MLELFRNVRFPLNRNVRFLVIKGYYQGGKNYDRDDFYEY